MEPKTTIVLNMYDPQGRFDLTLAEAQDLWAACEKEARSRGYNVEWERALYASDPVGDALMSEVFESFEADELYVPDADDFVHFIGGVVLL